MRVSAAALGLAGLTSAALCYALTMALWSWFGRYALAKPNARSSHRVPVPEGGGIPVVIAALSVAGLLVAFGPFSIAGKHWLAVIVAASAVMALIGFWDDIRQLPVLPRLGLQFAAAAAVVFSAPSEWQLLGGYIPPLAERAVCVVLGVWFVNLTNFMDGIDWLTVCEFVPLTASLVTLGFLGKTSPAMQVLAAALCGAIIGFAPFNKPAARLILGDAGSLPIGLLVAACLFDLAAHGAIAAAIVLPLYYICDATFTLLRRLLRGEPVWQAHRQHAYQRAVDGLWPVRNVVATVFCLNIGLGALAVVAATRHTIAPVLGAALLALALVCIVLRRFTKKIPV